jgi:hypothetical protein
MPLKVYDTQDAVPDDERDEYAEHEGKWHPKVTLELEAAKRKQAQLLNEKREEKRLREEAEHKVAEAERAAAAREKGISEDELQKIRDDEAKGRKPILDENESLKAENRKLKLTDRVQALYLANGGMQDRLEDAMESLGKRTDLGDQGGIVFKDKEGNVTADDAAAFFAKHKTEKPWFYTGNGSSGSGGSGSNGTGGVPATDKATVTAKKREQVQGAF